MLLFLDFIDEDFCRKSRVFKRRANPFDEYDDEEFVKRFRLSKKVVEKVHEQVTVVSPTYYPRYVALHGLWAHMIWCPASR